MTLGTDTVWNSSRFWSEPAERAFSAARRRARRERRKDRRNGESPTLARFHEVAAHRDLLPESDEHLETVPLESITGTVGAKETLFTRSFYPGSDAILPRWKRIYALARGLRGYPPIELYEAAGRFYVVDGHFRVSVARALGSETIQAHVRRWS